MRSTTLRSLLGRGLDRVRAFGSETSGIAAIEFAYIAPVLLIMLMGTFEISRAVSIDRRINSVSAMASEVVAREETAMTVQDLDKIAEAMEHVMAPYGDDTVVVRLVAVQASTTDANDTRVIWSYEHSGSGSSTPLAQCSPYALDAGLVSRGTGVIVAEVGYTYAPVFGDFVYRELDFTALDEASGDTSGIARNWKSRSFHAPRKGLPTRSGVTCNGGQCPAGCFN